MWHYSPWKLFWMRFFWFCMAVLAVVWVLSKIFGIDWSR